MNTIEAIGWIATLATIISFVPNGENKIRTINGIACLIWIVYGILTKTNPIIAVNTVVLLMHIVFFIKQAKNKKRIMNQTEWNRERDKMADQVKADPDFMYKWIKQKSGK